MKDTVRGSLLGVEPEDLEKSKPGCDQRQAEKEREQEHPLGSIEIPLGADHLVGVVVAFGFAREYDRQDAGDGKTPTAENGKQVNVLDVIARDYHLWQQRGGARDRVGLLNVQVGVDVALSVASVQRERLVGESARAVAATAAVALTRFGRRQVYRRDRQDELACNR